MKIGGVGKFNARGEVEQEEEVVVVELGDWWRKDEGRGMRGWRQ